MPSDALPDDPETLKAMLLAERVRERAAAPDHQGAAAASLWPPGGDAARGSDAAGPRRRRAGRGGPVTRQTDAARSPAERQARARKRRINRGALPAHLPRIEIVVDIDDKTCPCCQGELHRIGEDRSERLDIVPAQFRVLVTRRPKYACRACEDGVVQAPAPARLIEGGLPTEATVAQVLVSKYADHLPLYRQAQIYARQGIDLDRSTLADWVGRAALHLRPLHERLLDEAQGSRPSCSPTRRRRRCSIPAAAAPRPASSGPMPPTTGPGAASDPPGVAYVYAPDRKAERPIAHLAGFKGILQVDGYAGYRKLAERGDVQLAFCWVACAAPLLRTRHARPRADRQRGARTHRRALRHREGHPRPQRRGASRRPAAEKPAARRRTSNRGCAQNSV